MSSYKYLSQQFHQHAFMIPNVHLDPLHLASSAFVSTRVLLAKLMSTKNLKQTPAHAAAAGSRSGACNRRAALVPGRRGLPKAH